MKWYFGNQQLQDVYEKGKSRKYSFIDKKLAWEFVECVGRIEAAEDINDLRNPRSMNFKAMSGFENRFSIRLDLKHRLEFEINFEDERRISGTVRIIKVSKHYE